MSVKTKKFLKNVGTISEDEALVVLSSLTEAELEELCVDAEKLGEETREKLVALLESLPEEEAEDELTEDNIDTPAGKTIVTKTGMIAGAVSALNDMKPEDLSHFLDQALATSQQYASAIPDGTAAKNMASIAMKGAVKEDLNTEIFAGTELSEELKFKISTLFESAVNARVGQIGRASCRERVSSPV